MHTGRIEQLTVSPLPLNPIVTDFGRQSFQPSPVRGTEQVTVEVKSLVPNAKAPLYVQDGDVAADLYAAAATVIPARGRGLVSTGVALGFPEGFRGRIHARSGLSLKHGIETGAGLIDNKYRNEIGVLLYNFSDEDYQVSAGDRIAQICVERYEVARFAIVNELDATDRTSGWGSSGAR